jgi:hypothetical protein
VPAPYESARVVIEEVKKYYTEDGKSWASILPSFGVTLFCYGSSDDPMDNFDFAVAEGSSLTEVEGEYLVKLFKKYYRVKIVGEYITMEPVEDAGN